MFTILENGFSFKVITVYYTVYKYYKYSLNTNISTTISINTLYPYFITIKIHFQVKL